jgi:hypothetical protein
MKFHNIIAEFRIKLASTQNQQQLKKTVIDAFYNQLDNLDLSFSFFRKYYRKYIANLNRLKPDPEDKSPDLTLLRVALTENKWKPTTPFAICIHHLKYKNKISSKPFIAYQKKQNLKKRKTAVAKAKLIDKPNSSKKWTSVPIKRNQPQKPANTLGLKKKA